MIRELNEFQKKCENKFKESFRREEIKPSSRELEGENETYIKIVVDKISIYIYEDEGDFQGEKLDKRFEWQDYKTKDDLINDFTTTFVKIYKENR